MIKDAPKKNMAALAQLGTLLWPHHTTEELTAEFARHMDSGNSAFFIAWHEEQAIGFAHCQLRHEYVEGAESSPVGYLEGIFVKQEYRRQGYARTLLTACEHWAARQGCQEFASDCAWQNTLGQAFHRQAGFTEANQIICFIKPLA